MDWLNDTKYKHYEQVVQESFLAENKETCCFPQLLELSIFEHMKQTFSNPQEMDLFSLMEAQFLPEIG